MAPATALAYRYGSGNTVGKSGATILPEPFQNTAWLTQDGPQFSLIDWPTTQIFCADLQTETMPSALWYPMPSFECHSKHHCVNIDKHSAHQILSLTGNAWARNCTRSL